MNDPKHLEATIREMHGCRSTHVRSEPVTDTFKRDTAWNGVVEVFNTIGHPDAARVYAWTHEDADGTLHHQAVLGVPPINSALDAVRASVAAESQRRARSR